MEWSGLWTVVPRGWPKRAAVAAIALTLAGGLLVAPRSPAHYEETAPNELIATLQAAQGEPPAHPGEAETPAPTSAPAPTSSVIAAAVPARRGASAATRYSLAGGCFTLRSPATGALVRSSGDGYSAASASGGAEAFRMQATELGSYLLLDAAGRFVGTGGEAVRAVAEPSSGAEWTVRGKRGEFRIVSRQSGRPLEVEPASGEVILGGGAGATFAFEPARTCAGFPEVEVNATGRPNTGSPRYGEATGLIDLHSHIMAFEAFGGDWACGRTWHRHGVTRALNDADCSDRHNPATPNGLAHNLLTFQDPANDHHPGGWPNFEGWPTRETVFLHEQAYYRWIERAWRGGLRILTALAVDNSAACQLNVSGTKGCNEMDAVRRQLRSIKEMQGYIDAQHGGPGKGWFRIVRNPLQARRVINRGKLAVVLGIEVSEPLDCGLRNGRPTCDRAQIDRELDRVFRAGVRQMELVNKFDNALAGVAMDGGIAGPVVNTGNKIVTGEFWEVETCTGPDHDRTQDTSVPPEAEQLIALLPGGSLQLPVYPPPPHCNRKGLTDLGEHALRGLIERGMVFDPDHLSVRARAQALDLLEAHDYSGVVSSHSWADDTSYRRIMEMGGVVTPMAGDAERFVEVWEERRKQFADGDGSRRFGFGFGFGDDMNGLAGSRGPTAGTPAEISYPFRSLDGTVSLDRQQSGTRTYDVNTDGVGHFGLWPDWAQGVGQVGGGRIRRDFLGGAELYLRTWERAVGVPGPRARRARGKIGPRGSGRIRLGLKPGRLLRRAGQPHSRERAWSYRLRRRGGRRAELVAVFTHRRGGKREVGLVASNARRYKAGGIHPGMRAARLPAGTRSLGRGLRVGATDRARSRFVYVVKGGRVRAVGVATRRLATDRGRLARHLRLAGL